MYARAQVFLSVKGVYYQAEVQGQTITWLAPWQFSQVLPKSVDFKVMTTFLQFHEVRVCLCVLTCVRTLHLCHADCRFCSSL